MGITLNEHPRIQPLNIEWYAGKVAQLDMLRLDEVHPVISGNKWYKLKYNVEQLAKRGYKGVLTFGGAYSNHLIATAATAYKYGLKSVGIVRGEELANNLSPTLEQCKAYGMELVFISRSEYRRKTEVAYLNILQEKHSELYIVPEGGANEWGRLGANEIGETIPRDYTHVCVSVGTGTTMAGIASSVGANVLGYAPMKGGQYLKENLKEWVEGNNYELFDDWHFGGFGKHKPELIRFINGFYNLNKIPLDIVYTAKMMYGVNEQLIDGFFPIHAKVLCIHTGGLQGNISVSGQLGF